MTAPIAPSRQAVLDLVTRFGYERRAEPFQLTSGQWSRDYVDGKRVIARGDRLQVVARAMLTVAEAEGVRFRAVGGLTMGADPFAVGIAAVAGDVEWFSVRKEAKRHGKQKRIEGADVTAGTPVLLVDDVVTTGKSILEAFDALDEVGAQVVLACTLVDRGDIAGARLAERGVLYRPLLTYRDLGIEPIGAG